MFIEKAVRGVKSAAVKSAVAVMIALLFCASVFTGCDVDVSSDSATYKIEFKSNAENSTGEVVTISAPAGSKVVISRNGFTLEGYVFTGWNTKADGSGTAYAAGDYVELKKNLTLYAQWEKEKLKITFSANSIYAEGSMENIEFNAGDVITLPENKFTLEGYVFEGWNTKADGRGADYSDKAEITLTENVVLYAQWRKLGTFTVAFVYDNGDPIDRMSILYGEKLTRPEDPVRLGYSFDGWYAGETIYDFNSAVVQNITLTAKWNINKYTVSFDSNGGTNVDPQTVEHSKCVSVPETPELEGATFIRWNLGDDEYNFDTPVTKDIQLKAVWKINYFVVKFDSNGGDSVVDQHVNFEGFVTEPSAPSKTGHTFVCWNLDDTKYDFTAPVKKSITLKAVWKANEYTVSFDSDGGTNVDPQTVEYGKRATAPAAPSKEGKTFVCWNKDGKEFDFNSQIIADVQLKAVWKIASYEVTFDLDDGSNATSQSVNYKSTVTKPADPSRTGYTFVCWNLGESEYNFATPVTKPIELKAVWKINQYTVTFNTNGEYNVSSQTVEYGQKLTKPADLEKTGYTFKGWNKGSKFYDFDTPVAETFELTAVFEINKYKVKFMTDSTVYAVQDVTYNTKVTNPGVPFAEDKLFEVWTLNGSDYNFDTLITGELTITAKWKDMTDKCIVSYKNADGSYINQIIVDKNTTLAQPSDPSLQGYMFAGWYVKGGEKFDFATPVTGNLVLVATWFTKTVVLQQVVSDGEIGLTFDASTNTFTADEGYVTYAWYIGKSLVSGEKSNTYRPDIDAIIAGNYQVNVVARDSKGDIHSSFAQITIVNSIYKNLDTN